MAKKEEKQVGPEWLDHTTVIEGLKWIKGAGELPSDFMIVAERPGIDDIAVGSIFSGPAGREVLFPTMNKAQFRYLKEGKSFCEHVAPDPSDFAAYFTNAVKYAPPGKRAINAGDLKLCKPVLQEEIKRCEPKIIICLGAQALTAVLGRGHKLGDYRGAFVDHPDMPGTQVYATYNPAYILRNPEKQADYDRDWSLVAAHQEGGIMEEQDKTDYAVIQTVAALRQFKEQLFASYENPFVMVDCEWHGATWMSPDRYIRTVQLGFDEGQAVVVEFWDEGVVPEGETWTTDCKGDVMDDHDAAWAVLKEILEDPRIQIGGQNVIADGEWLASYGIDIRPRTVYDTMLAEHLFNESGPFALEELTVKYTRMGRYDLPVKQWYAANKKICAHGFGPIPRKLLLPYGAKDVTAPWRIAFKQAELLQPYTEPRGEYPSLWETQMDTQQTIYELEQTGMLTDRTQLDSLTVKYKEVLSELTARAIAMATHAGVENFNHRSTAQVAHLLFDVLGLQPIKTTGGRPWADHMKNQSPEAQELYKPSTDMNTLEILQEKHPFAKMMADIRRIDTITKYFLRDATPGFDAASRGGGIIAKIWIDGRLHPHFSQLSETGRFKTSKPNCQNWPKRAEGYLWKIFDDLKKDRPEQIRTIIVPSPGCVLMESDFVQAELFVLAALSGDDVMWGTLTTPGKDMHDMTAITSFQLSVLGPDGLPMPEQYLLDLAASDFDAFEKLQKQLNYVDLRGRTMSRSDFKNTIRVSAKNLNFGIPYGRGALDIARQVKGETGTAQGIDELESEIAQMMEVWKEETFVKAWGYMGECAEAVTSAGFIQNPWGRRRHFVVGRRGEGVAGLRREAQNFPIQSTVADTCMIAMTLVKRYRAKHNLHFKIVNQIHDAIMLEVPEAEIEATKTMFRETMGKIDIPIVGRSEPLRLGIDIDVMTRWGEKVK